MRALRALALILLVSGLASAQGVPGALTPCKMDGTGCGGASGTVTTTGTLASGQVALGSGATSITGDAGCTWTGTGTNFVVTVGSGGNAVVLGAAAGLFGTSFGVNYLNFGTRANTSGQHVWVNSANVTTGTVDLALSRASAGTLLVEDGSGNARDVQARTGTFGTSVVTPVVSNATGITLQPFAPSNAYSLNVDNNGIYPLVGNTQTVGLSSIPFSTGYFGTSLQSPLLVSGPGKSGTNVAGTNNTIQAEPGTGSATGSSIVFQTPTAGASGATAQTQATRLTLSEPAVIAAVPVRLMGYTVATLPAGTVGDTAYVTDATAPTYLGALTGGGAVTVKVFFNGSAWVSN